MPFDEEGLSIILTPVQLAAVMESETIGEEGTIANRLIGVLRIVGCGVGAVGATALAAAPEPTMITKVGAVGLAGLAADQCATGGRQIWTGRSERSLTDQGASALARGLGASPRTADNIGMAVEMIAPLAVASIVGAIRAAAIRSGRISLARHEAVAGSRIGGHTIARHVGQTEAQLRARIVATAGSRRPPSVISTFDDIAAAERSVSVALKSSRSLIQSWAGSPAGSAPLRLEFNAGSAVGQGVLRSTGQLQRMSKIRVILKKETYNGMPYYVLTSFPIP